MSFQRVKHLGLGALLAILLGVILIAFWQSRESTDKLRLIIEQHAPARELLLGINDLFKRRELSVF